MELEVHSKQMNKKKKIYEIEKKNIEIIGAPPSNYPWFGCFDNIFFGIIKINGILNAKGQGVHVMNFKIGEW
jgi:hypothetical protein